MTRTADRSEAAPLPLCPPALLTDHCTALLAARGLPAMEAETVAQSLVHANLRGVDSHGVTRMPIYIDRLERGIVNPRPDIGIVHDRGATLSIDGDNGMGAVVASRALDLALTRVEAHGSVTIGIHNSNHYGSGAYYAEKAVQRDTVAFLYSNAPPTMAPWGGVDPYLGTNPYTFAAPAGDFPPVILDMATSVVARGKIIMAANSGEPIPPGWAIDKEGIETRDPQAALAGSVLPFGGAKGYGIAMMIDVMAGVMTGAAFGPRIGDLYKTLDAPQDVGVFMHLVHAGAFLPADMFKQRVDAMISQIKANRPARDVEEVMVPGEIEARMAKRRAREGIPLPVDLVDQLDRLASGDMPSLCRALGVGSHRTEEPRQ